MKQVGLLQAAVKEQQGLPVVSGSSSHGIVVSMGRGALGMGAGRSMALGLGAGRSMARSVSLVRGGVTSSGRRVVPK